MPALTKRYAFAIYVAGINTEDAYEASQRPCVAILPDLSRSQSQAARSADAPGAWEK